MFILLSPENAGIIGLMDEERKAPMNFKTTPDRKRLAQVLLGVLNQPDMTSLMEYALDRLIVEYIPPDLQNKLLGGEHSPVGKEGAPSSGLPEAQRPRRKAKAA